MEHFLVEQGQIESALLRIKMVSYLNVISLLFHSPFVSSGTAVSKKNCKVASLHPWRTKTQNDEGIELRLFTQNQPLVDTRG